MAALDFPASPTLGQVYAAAGGPTYIWDGAAWIGGQITGPVTEQVFDMSGKTAQDIPIPSWAKTCEIEGYAFAAPASMCMRYSLDGTTFLAGASDYAYYGPYHQTGTAGWVSQPAINASVMYLNYAGDSVTFPHHFVANLTLTRPGTGQTLGTYQSHGQVLDSNTANLNRTVFVGGYMTVAAAGSALRPAALRILLAGGQAMPAGAWVRVRWFGDSAQVPISNAIPEAPMDGQGYVRESGLWVPSGVRKIGSGVLASAAAQIDLVLPAGYNAWEILLANIQPTTDIQNLCMRYSQDGGASFISAANYAWTGNASLSVALTNVVTGGNAQTVIGLSPALSNNITVSATFRITMPMVGGGFGQHALSHCCAYQSSPAQWVNYNGSGVGMAGVNAVRLFFPTGNIAAGARWQLNGYK